MTSGITQQDEAGLAGIVPSHSVDNISSFFKCFKLKFRPDLAHYTFNSSSNILISELKVDLVS